MGTELMTKMSASFKKNMQQSNNVKDNIDSLVDQLAPSANQTIQDDMILDSMDDKKSINDRKKEFEALETEKGQLHDDK